MAKKEKESYGCEW